MKKYAIGFVLGGTLTWLAASKAAECTAPECNLPQPVEFVDITAPLPKGNKRKIEALHDQTEYLLARITLLEQKHVEICNHVYGCDPVP